MHVLKSHTHGMVGLLWSKCSERSTDSQIWRAILSDDPGMTGPAWCDISKDAKDFVQQLLAKCVSGLAV